MTIKRHGLVKRQHAMWFRITLAVFGLAFLLCFQQDQVPENRVAAQAEDKSESASLKLIWQRTVGIPVYTAASFDGSYIVTIDDDGALRCFGDGGKVIWNLMLPGVNRAVIGPDGSALAYSSLNPTDTTAYLIDSKGQLLWKHNVAGAIWSAAASIEPGRFAIGTGEKYCYSYRITERRHRYRRWRLPGVPCSICYAHKRKSLLLGSWQDSGIAEFSLDGKEISWRKGRSDKLFYLEWYPDGNLLLVISKPNRSIPQAAVYLKDGSLKPIWGREFLVQNLRADVSRTGDFVAVGYQRNISHEDKEIMENRVALFDRTGKVVWEKGGMFGEWELMQICGKNRALVYDDSAYAYILGESGKVLIRQKLPATVRSFTRVPLRNRIAISCGNGQLCLYEVK